MSERYCTKCGKELKAGRVVWLELSWKSGKYAECGEVEPLESQGCFPFGADCAQAELKGEETK
jgi:hypothetical protein